MDYHTERSAEKIGKKNNEKIWKRWKTSKISKSLEKPHDKSNDKAKDEEIKK